MILQYSNKVTDKDYNLFMSLMHVSVSKHLFDEHFTVIWANDYFYKLIGYSKEEYENLYHNHVDEYFKDDPDELAKMGRLVLDAYERNDFGYEFECKMHTKGGKYSWIRVTGRFTDELYNGIPVIYTIYTDITSLKEMQLELEAQSNKLRKALDMAECASRAKSDFLSRMSHDIRTPMNAIIGMTNIAASHLGNPVKMRDCLNKITLSSQHLLGLINDVLDMSKIESGKMTLNNESMSLPDLLENVVTIMQPSVKAKQQQLSVRLNNVKHEQFYSDPLRLRQVFINILSNAVKFTPDQGMITFDIEELCSDQQEIAHFRFTITDTGMGIRPEFIKHIFDVFTREKDSRVDKTEGSGLGMAISKKIVEMIGGEIEIQSQLGEGTSFIVNLPLRIDRLGDEIQYDQIQNFPDMRILVVDDDEIMCEYTTQMLNRIGICAEWTNSSDRAIEKVKEAHEAGNDYSAVILDWKMPDRDGIQTTRLLRKYTRADLPVLIISAYDWTDIEEEARQAGVNGFLTKPVFLSTLYRGLKKYVLELPSLDEKGRNKLFDFSGKRFLLVEDNDLNREIAIELLSAVGAIVEYACNGEEGLAKFEQSPVFFYDLILMDIQMPVMNGYVATEKIRGLSRKDALSIPILAMTADAFSEDIKAAKNAGMNGHLAKPLDVMTMNREIDKFVHK